MKEIPFAEADACRLLVGSLPNKPAWGCCFHLVEQSCFFFRDNFDRWQTLWEVVARNPGSSRIVWSIVLIE